LLQPGDEIVVESHAFGTQNGVSTGMIHGGIRTMIARKGLAFNLVNPTNTKKFVAVTGWTGEKGNKRRLKDKEKKGAMKTAVWEHFGWTHKSHDVVDAYVIARIALNVYRYRELLVPLDVQDYQEQVVRDILGEGAAR
jgi:crossover junction endodeoxyribonuclease RuvC